MVLSRSGVAGLSLILGALLAACVSPASVSIDTWARSVVAGDLSSAAAMMEESGLGIWSWQEDTHHWNESWGGMQEYRIIEGPMVLGNSRNYTIKWIWRNEKVQCLKVQETGTGKIAVLGDYQRCPDATNSSGGTDR